MQAIADKVKTEGWSWVEIVPTLATTTPIL
jgi:hypothetical protein